MNFSELLTGLKTEDNYMATVETKSTKKRESGEKRARFVEDGSIGRGYAIDNFSRICGYVKLVQTFIK